MQRGGSRLPFSAHGLQEHPVWTEDPGSGPGLPGWHCIWVRLALVCTLDLLPILPFFLCPQQFVPKIFLFQFIALMFNFSLIYIY